MLCRYIYRANPFLQRMRRTGSTKDSLRQGDSALIVPGTKNSSSTADTGEKKIGSFFKDRKALRLHRLLTN